MSRPVLPDDPMALSYGLAWINRASHGRFNHKMVMSAMAHRAQRGTDPAILIHAALVWLSLGLDRTPDSLNQYWHIVDQVSARVRSTYLQIPVRELL